MTFISTTSDFLCRANLCQVGAEEANKCALVAWGLVCHLEAYRLLNISALIQEFVQLEGILDGYGHEDIPNGNGHRPHHQAVALGGASWLRMNSPPGTRSQAPLPSGRPGDPVWTLWDGWLAWVSLSSLTFRNQVGWRHMNQPGEAPGETVGQRRGKTCAHPRVDTDLCISGTPTAQHLCSTICCRPGHLTYYMFMNHGQSSSLHLPPRTEPCSGFSTQEALTPFGLVKAHSEPRGQ